MKKNERIFAENFARNYEKNNTWNIRRLVDETIVPATQHIILKIVGFLGPSQGSPTFFSSFGYKKKNRYLVFIIDPILFIFFLRNQKFYVKFEFCFVNSRRLDGLMQHLLHSCFRKCNAIFLMRHLMFI